MWHVYILKSQKNGKHYVGCSKDLERRLKEHNLGKNTSTMLGVPWCVVYKESFEHPSDAYNREKKIKSYKSGNAFKKLLGL